MVLPILIALTISTLTTILSLVCKFDKTKNMAEFIVNTKNRKEEKVVEAFLSSLSITYYAEEDENAALYQAMQTDRKTSLLTKDEKEAFVKKLKFSK